ncbi:MAG: 3-oxoacyl-ACP reductase family protein [Polyangiales bacterium]
MFDLQGKRALVTGGSRGIGRAICVRLAQAGAEVVISYQGNESAAQQSAAAVTAAGGKATLSRFDVGDAAAVDAAFGAFNKETPIDILVNNAGISIDQLLMRVGPEAVEKSFRTNVYGALWCAKAAMRGMMRRKWGRIIQLSSVVGESGNAGQSVYSATKAALIGLTKTLAREYASRGITVNAVAPGYITTDMTAVLGEAVQAQVLASTPAGRIGNPEEVAAAVHFLASEEAGYVTGQVLRVNGGMYM